MPKLKNPFQLSPASANEFVGRHDLLKRWEDRLTLDSDAWNSAQSWLIVGEGGVGKSSLLNKMGDLAKKQFNAHVINLDLGLYRHLNKDDDFFYWLDSQLPPAKKWSSRLRRWFDLPATASDLQVTTEFLSLISRFAIAFSSVNWNGVGLEFSPEGKEPNRPKSFFERLIITFNRLALLSEEQNKPVVLLVDQLGKIHDAYLWLMVGYMLLQLAERNCHYQISNIICVFCLRPGRKGQLEHQFDYHLKRSLFEKETLHIERLHPFHRQEAMTAIIERAKGQGWGHLIAGKIAKALNGSEGIDPYHIILGASAVWDHLYSGEEPKQPQDLDDTAVYEIVRQGHGYLLDSVRNRSAIQGAVLSLLAFYPAGLNLEEITFQLNVRRTSATLTEVDQAVLSLSDQAGYRLLDIIPKSSPSLYTLAHDILREHLQERISPDERNRRLIQKLMDEGTWRYEQNYSAEPFNRQNLDLLWQNRAQLLFSRKSWEAIVNSELALNENRLFFWFSQYPDSVEIAVAQLNDSRSERMHDYSLRLMLAYFLPTYKTLFPILCKLASNAKDKYVRQEVAEFLGEFGEQAVEMLNKLARDKELFVRRQAVKSLGRIGKPALEVLNNLALYSRDETLRQEIAGLLGDFGEPGLRVLSRLAQNDENLQVRRQAVENLGKIGEPARSVLTKLAKNDNEPIIRRQSVIGLSTFGVPVLGMLSDIIKVDENLSVQCQATQSLGSIGEPALELLIELTQNKYHGQLRLEAAITLKEFGSQELAIWVLNELAWNDDDLYISRQATAELAKIGMPAFSKLSSLAQSSVDAEVRRLATDSLYEIGEPALEILSELALADKDVGVRQLAIKGLGKIGVPALPVLKETVESDKHQSLHMNAVEALWEIDEQQLCLNVAREVVLNSSNREERLHATYFLGQKGGEFALTVLMEVVKKDEWIRVRRTAAEYLAKSGEKALTILSELVHTCSDFVICRYAIDGLRDIGQSAMSVLIEVAKDEENIERGDEYLHTVLFPILEILWKFDEEDIVRSVLDKILQKTPQLSTSHLKVAEFYVAMGDQEAAIVSLKALARLAQSRGLRVRAVNALGKLDDLVLPVLVEVIQNDRVAKVLRAAADALGNFGKSGIHSSYISL